MTQGESTAVMSTVFRAKLSSATLQLCDLRRLIQPLWSLVNYYGLYYHVIFAIKSYSPWTKDEHTLKQKQIMCSALMEFTRTGTGQAATVKVDFMQEMAFEWGLEGQTLNGFGKERKQGA